MIDPEVPAWPVRAPMGVETDGAGPGAAAAKGAVAFVMRSVGSDEHRMPHTGTTRYVEGRVPLPGFALSSPDADQVSRLIAMWCHFLSVPVDD